MLDAHVNYAEGQHITADFSGVAKSKLNDPKYLEDALVKAINRSGATLLKVHTESFEPQGVTVVAVLAESHATIHTYPEHGVAMIDAFTCGNVDPEPIVEALSETLQPVNRKERGFSRTPIPISETAYLYEPIANGLERRWRLNRLICEKRTKYQHFIIAETEQGISLFCNSERQSTELSQLLYHEGQIIPAALSAGKIENVLVIGSSEGVVCEIAVELGAKLVVHVDIDQECVEACAKHLPYGYSETQLKEAVSGKGRVRIKYADGIEFVQQHAELGGAKFDIVILDLPDENVNYNAQQNRAYAENFLESVKLIRADNGSVICQAGCTTLWRNEALRNLWLRMGRVFSNRIFFELNEQDWCWIVGCNSGRQITSAEMAEKLRLLSYSPVHIDEQTIMAGTIPPLSLRNQN